MCSSTTTARSSRPELPRRRPGLSRVVDGFDAGVARQGGRSGVFSMLVPRQTAAAASAKTPRRRRAGGRGARPAGAPARSSHERGPRRHRPPGHADRRAALLPPRSAGQAVVRGPRPTPAAGGPGAASRSRRVATAFRSRGDGARCRRPPSPTGCSSPARGTASPSRCSCRARLPASLERSTRSTWPGMADLQLDAVEVPADSLLDGGVETRSACHRQAAVLAAVETVGRWTPCSR